MSDLGLSSFGVWTMAYLALLGLLSRGACSWVDTDLPLPWSGGEGNLHL